MNGDAPNFGGNISDQENINFNRHYFDPSDANGSQPSEQ